MVDPAKVSDARALSYARGVIPEAVRLRAALVSAYPAYVFRLLAERRIVADPIVRRAVDLGAKALDSDLEALLSLPARDQDRSPLEAFRAALSFPTAALREIATPPVARDPAAVRLLPDDHYDLAPGGSAQLGEEVQSAHLAWGAAKARSIADPVATSGQPRSPQVAVVATVRAERDQIESAAGAAGFDVVLIRNPAALDRVLEQRPPSLAFVDLSHPLADPTIRSLAARRVRVVAFDDSIDDFAAVRASALGARRVLERSRFLAAVDDFIPGLA